MFPKCFPDVPRKNGKLGNIDKKVANPLRINDFHFGRLRRERLSNLWFLRISQNTQISVYQLFVKFVKNQDITKYLSVSLFLGVKLGVDFEITPKLRFAGYKCIHDNKKKMLASGSVPIIL